MATEHEIKLITNSCIMMNKIIMNQIIMNQIRVDL